jgi:CubicO group peptidase (beta-lactamase class C family)
MREPVLTRRALMLGAGAAVAAAPLARAGWRTADASAPIDALVGKLVADGSIAGISWCVASAEAVLARGMAGWMDRPHNIAMRQDTLFAMASQTKPVTAVAILMLLEAGKLKLTDPIDRFLPEFSHPMMIAVAGAEPVPVRVPTIAELLTHTSGLGSGAAADQGNNALFQLRPGTPHAEVVKQFAATPYGFAPGTRWLYSPVAGFHTLGLIVEAISGQPVDVFYRERIFAPLGMIDTSFGVPEAKRARVATIHQPENGALVPANLPSPFAPDSGVVSAAGNLYSTVDDYLAFARMLLGKGSYRGRRLLRPETAALLSSDMAGALCCSGAPMPPVGWKFGLAMQVLDDPVPTHAAMGRGTYGWGGAFGTSFNIDPAHGIVNLYMMQMWNVPKLNPAVPWQFHELAGAFRG